MALKIREIRERQGITLTEFQVRLQHEGLTYGLNSLSYKERGLRGITLAELRVMAKVLAVTWEELTNGETIKFRATNDPTPEEPTHVG